MAVTPGTLLRLAEDQYRYGVGPLMLRYEDTIEVVRMSDGDWATVRGVEVRPDGRDGDRRIVAIPAKLLRGAR